MATTRFLFDGRVAPRFNTHLDTLVLVGNGVTDAAGVQLAHAAAHHPALASLALGGNAIGDESARAFGDALRESETLLALNLAHSKYHYAHFRDKARRRRKGLSALAYLKAIKLDRGGPGGLGDSRPTTANVEVADAAIEAVRAMESDLEKTYEGLEGFNPVTWGAPADDPLYVRRSFPSPRSSEVGLRARFLYNSSLHEISRREQKT